MSDRRPQVAESPAVETGQEVKTPALYKVFLLNDDYTIMVATPDTTAIVSFHWLVSSIANYDELEGGVTVAGVWRRILSATEIAELSANPYQFLIPA